MRATGGHDDDADRRPGGEPARRAFRQRTHNLGLRVDVAGVAEALEVLDDEVEPPV